MWETETLSFFLDSSGSFFDLHLNTQESGCTHSAVNGAQRHEALHVVGEGSTVGVPVGVLSSLQDELLALEVMVLETNPAAGRKREREKGAYLHNDPQTSLCCVFLRDLS